MLAITLVAYVNLDSENGIVGSLGGTTALLLLCVFAVVNVSLLVLRREKAPEDAFHAPTIIPILGVVFCLFLAGPWARSREDWVQYEIAGLLLVIGVALWALTWLINRINYKKGIIETRPGDYK